MTPTTAGFYAKQVECDGALCVVAHGEIDVATAPVLDDVLRAAEASDAPEIVLDIEAVSFIDSTGLRALLEARARSRQNGDRLRLTRGTAQAQRLFALAGVDRHLRFVDP